MGVRRTGSTKAELEADRRVRDLRRTLALDLRRQCEDAGISQARLANAAHLSTAQVSRIFAGSESPSLHSLAALSVALDGRLVVRIDPITGPRIRDHLQARILEALLRILHPRWKRVLEVPVYRPVRGVVDAVLHDPAAGVAIATEVHSQIRRFEQQLRWANAKADALLKGSELPLFGPGGEQPTVSRMLLLRSTAASRELARTLAESFRAAYPGSTREAFHSLTSADARWPGSSLIWARVDGSNAAIMSDPPRGITLGR